MAIPDDGPAKSEVAVDLDLLVSMGQVLLPALANDYGHLNQMAADAAGNGGPLFDWTPGSSGTPSGGGMSGAAQIGTQWTLLCEMLQNAFGHSATSLQEAGSTLLAIERHYQCTDGVSASELKAVWDSQIWPQDDGFQQKYDPVHVTVTDQP